MSTSNEAEALVLTPEELDSLREQVKKAGYSRSCYGNPGGEHSFHFYKAVAGELLFSVSVDPKLRVYTPTRWLTTRAELYAELRL